MKAYTRELLSRIPNRPMAGAEIGVYKAANAGWLLAKRPRLELLLVDPWAPWVSGGTRPGPGRDFDQKQWDEIYRQAKVGIRPHGDRATFIRATSCVASQLVDDASLRFVFIDANHTYDACLEDIQLWIPKVSAGGWIGGHDYGHPREKTDGWGVSQAVNESFGHNIELGAGGTWFASI